MLLQWQKGNTIPLANDNTAILPSKFVPHANAFNKIFGASIDRLRAFRGFSAIVNPPAHGLHDDRSRGGVFRVRRHRGACIGTVLSDDWSIRVWGYVVTRLYYGQNVKRGKVVLDNKANHEIIFIDPLLNCEVWMAR